MILSVTKSEEYPILLKLDKNYDSWSLLNQIATDHPQIDSLTWIDDFNERKFLGAIPGYPFYISFIDKPSAEIEPSEKEQADTLSYNISGLSAPDSILLGEDAPNCKYLFRQAIDI